MTIKKQIPPLIILTIGLAYAIILLIIPTYNMGYVQATIQNQYHDWDDPAYEGWICHDKSLEIERYVETHLGLDCYIVYGCNSTCSHMWNMILVDEVFVEFESTNLRFMKTSNLFHVEDIRHGFYIDGVRVDYCERVKDWEKLL